MIQSSGFSYSGSRSAFQLQNTTTTTSATTLTAKSTTKSTIKRTMMRTTKTTTSLTLEREKLKNIRFSIPYTTLSMLNFEELKTWKKCFLENPSSNIYCEKYMEKLYYFCSFHKIRQVFKQHCAAKTTPEPMFSLDTWYRIGHALLSHKKSKTLFEKHVVKNLTKEDFKILLIDNQAIDSDYVAESLKMVFTEQEIFYLKNFDVDHHDYHSEGVFALMYASSLFRKEEIEEGEGETRRKILPFLVSLAMVDVEKMIPQNRGIKIWIDLFNQYANAFAKFPKQLECSVLGVYFKYEQNKSLKNFKLLIEPLATQTLDYCNEILTFRYAYREYISLFPKKSIDFLFQELVHRNYVFLASDGLLDIILSSSTTTQTPLSSSSTTSWRKKRVHP